MEFLKNAQPQVPEAKKRNYRIAGSSDWNRWRPSGIRMKRAETIAERLTAKFSCADHGRVIMALAIPMATLQHLR